MRIPNRRSVLNSLPFQPSIQDKAGTSHFRMRSQRRCTEFRRRVRDGDSDGRLLALPSESTHRDRIGIHAKPNEGGTGTVNRLYVHCIFFRYESVKRYSRGTKAPNPHLHAQDQVPTCRGGEITTPYLHPDSLRRVLLWPS